VETRKTAKKSVVIRTGRKPVLFSKGEGAKKESTKKSNIVGGRPRRTRGKGWGVSQQVTAHLSKVKLRIWEVKKTPEGNGSREKRKDQLEKSVQGGKSRSTPVVFL